MSVLNGGFLQDRQQQDLNKNLTNHLLTRIFLVLIRFSYEHLGARCK